MRIGVISDTHIPVVAKELPKKLLEALKNCELILHAGDLVELFVLEKLKKISPVKAVRGNMDSYNLMRILPQKDLMEVNGKRIGLMHGFGSPDELIGLLKNEFKKERIDIIVFGHSHSPFNKKIDGIIFFNPGSPTDTIYAPYNSYGIIEIVKDIKTEIIRL